MTLNTLLGRPLTLPCGVELVNRIGKSAMSEQLGDAQGAPTAALTTLYKRWSEGGAGLVLTGNVMIDRLQLGEPKNVVLESADHLEAFARWANAGSAIWMQLNHPGRQAPRFASTQPVAPSAVPFGPPGVFAPPRALESAEVEALVRRFGTSAGLAKQAGFAGVQIHGAHGYLVSQFLSPHTNLRDDAWGGSAVRRRRFVLAVVEEMRASVGPDFPIGIKLNSADFQRGGFTETEALEVVAALEDAGIDLIEISGGTYESPKMMGHADAPRASTLAREAYFLEFAERARARVRLPLMLTGGFRTRRGMEGALGSGAVDVVGLARPLAVVPNLPALLLAGAVEGYQAPVPPSLGLASFDGYLEIVWHAQQLQRMGAGLDPDPHRPAWLAAAIALYDNGLSMLAPRRG